MFKITKESFSWILNDCQINSFSGFQKALLEESPTLRPLKLSILLDMYFRYFPSKLHDFPFPRENNETLLNSLLINITYLLDHFHSKFCIPVFHLDPCQMYFFKECLTLD